MIASALNDSILLCLHYIVNTVVWQAKKTPGAGLAPGEEHSQTARRVRFVVVETSTQQAAVTQAGYFPS
jgi:hypothetical protein